MNAKLIFLFWLLLVLLFVIGAIAVMAARRGRVVRPAHFHWVVRVLGAVLVLAALVAVGVGTWRGTSAEFASPAVRVSLPTHAPPPLPGATQANGKVDLGPSQLIATVLLVRKVQDQFLPLCGESRTLAWPPTGDPELAFEGESNGSSYEVRMNLSEFMRWNDDEAVRATRGVSVASKGWNWSSGGSMELKLDTLEVENFGGFIETLDHAPLSLIPVATVQDLGLLVYLTRADRDDPLRQVSASDWLSGEGRNLRRDERHSNSSRRPRLDRSAPPGLRMMVFLGPSALLLLLAAVVGSAWFPQGRRAVGFAGLLAGMVLYAGALDAVVMERRARVAADASQPEIVRAIALDNMRGATFFHTGKAAERVRDLAKSPAAEAE